METEQTIEALSALAQSTRLDAFRLLVRHEPEGMAAGALADALEVPANTMSSHLGILTRAGLVTAERRGRSIIYRPSLARLRGVLSYLLKDCCGGRPEICVPLISELETQCITSGVCHVDRAS